MQPQPQAAHSGEFLGLALHFSLFLPPDQVSLLQIEGTPPKEAPVMLPFGATLVILSLSLLFPCVGNEALKSHPECFNWNCKDERG